MFFKIIVSFFIYRVRRTFGETADPALEDNAVAAASDGTGEASLLAGLTTEQVVFFFPRIAIKNDFSKAKLGKSGFYWIC
jgi:hypothetical protein